jgi:hypothetical protein
LKAIEGTLRRFDADVAGIFGNRYVDLLLCGSVVLGDYAPGRGDIDFVVVVKDDLREGEIAAIFEAHDRYRAERDTLAWQLEGCYYPEAIVRDRSARAVGCYIGTRRKGWKRIGGDAHNPFDWLMLARYPRPYRNAITAIAPPGDAELREYARRESVAWMAIADDADVPAYAMIQWAARALAYLDRGALASKTEALEYARVYVADGGALGGAKLMRAPCDAAEYEARYPDARSVGKALLGIVRGKL